jgi:polyhydroxyalkanoate synthase subunit PhaC
MTEDKVGLGSAETNEGSAPPSGSNPTFFWPAAPPVAVRAQPRTLSPTQRPTELPADVEDIEPPPALDRLLHAAAGRFTAGLSPASLALAYVDWAMHLAAAPGKRQQLLEKAARKLIRLLTYAMRQATDRDVPPCIEPLPQDRRFSGELWRQWPFNLTYQAFLLQQQWWHNATTGIGGVSRHHQQVSSFAARQWLDVFAPSNFIFTNPEVLEATLREGGLNLARGFMNLLEDWERILGGRSPLDANAFKPGVNVAATRGEVVFRNRLIELIQYAPSTVEVRAEPVLIVPAWIMKYYILDLSEQNSLVKYLVDRGHTVFMISWHNPRADDRDLGLDDYLRLGPLAALDAIRTIVPDRQINAVGYCLGGTLLAIAATFLAREHRTELNSITLLAAQTDFTEAGELTLFIDEDQLDFLDDMMWNQGYLDTRQMSGAFQLLRSNDLVWSRVTRDYLMGQRAQMTDLMAWNADTTRMPYRMHSEYLRRLFLDNDLFEGRYTVEGRTVALRDIRVPIFAVATEQDHVAPWRSVYKINLINDAGVTFVLTSGGHNAGIVSEPGHPHRHYRLALCTVDQPHVDADTWYGSVTPSEGSWWPAWASWLEEKSEACVPPPELGAPAKGFPPLGPSPGRYIHER